MAFYIKFDLDDLRQCCDELKTYAKVFNRVARAFDNIEEEADLIEKKALVSPQVDPYGDPGKVIEDAYDMKVGFYVSMNAARRGILNLMIAGLFHMFEQQASSLLETKSNDTVKHLVETFKEASIDVSSFQSYKMVDKLRLIANSVKHGEGKSTDALCKKYPELFDDDPLYRSRTPLLPLIGQGLKLKESDFKVFQDCLEQFWNELFTVYKKTKPILAK